MKKYAIIICMFILFQSCQKLKNGNVIEKWYEPENTYMTLMPIFMSNGKITSVIYVPYYIHDNEDYCVKVTGIGTKGDTITRTYYVDKSVYDSLYVGKFVCVDGKCDEDNNNMKVRKYN